MKPQGHCIERCTPVVLPDGSVETAAIWQHRSGAKGIYAHIEGAFYSVQPSWCIQGDEYGQPVYQGMGLPFPRNIVDRIHAAIWRWQQKRASKTE